MKSSQQHRSNSQLVPVFSPGGPVQIHDNTFYVPLSAENGRVVEWSNTRGGVAWASALGLDPSMAAKDSWDKSCFCMFSKWTDMET
ncbi:hypothetical protein QG37_00820 [Candidozyma auris]|nr:hypothetical protein QG37_00820 [[Candida] auris]